MMTSSGPKMTSSGCAIGSPVEDISPQMMPSSSGPGPPVVSRARRSPAQDTPDWEGRKVQGSLDAQHQQALEEGGGRTEEKSTLKPAQAAFESGSEGSGETEISPDVREAVLETAGLGGAPPIQAVTRDGKDKIVLTTDWLVETVEDGTSLRLLIRRKDGSFEARKFPSS